MAEEEKSYFDKILHKLKNNKLFAWLMIIGFVSGTLWTLLPKTYKDQLNDWINNQELPGLKQDQYELLQFAEKYYTAVMQNQLNVNEYFAPKVTQFITVADPSIQEIETLFAQSRNEFIQPKIIIFDSTLVVSKKENGLKSADFWISFQCFRQSKLQYQSCNVHVEMTIDESSKIVSYKELDVKNLSYYNKETHYLGNVGKLNAEFDLVIDYTTKQVTGTYFYPSRKGIVYSLSGSISETKMLLNEYTRGELTAVCTLTSLPNQCYSGEMNNTNGKVLSMQMCAVGSTKIANR
jgi:hypothetical protein